MAASESCLLDDDERWTPPAPRVVGDDVGRVNDERSVVSVELARLVAGTVVVRVTDQQQVSVELARLRVLSWHVLSPGR